MTADWRSPPRSPTQSRELDFFAIATWGTKRRRLPSNTLPTKEILIVKRPCSRSLPPRLNVNLLPPKRSSGANGQRSIAVIGQLGENATTAGPTIGDTGALVQLRARAARQLDLEDRWSYFAALSNYPPTDEWRRQSEWYEGLPLRPPPTGLVLPAPNEVEDLDGARLAWHRALVGIIDSAAGERADQATAGRVRSPSG